MADSVGEALHNLTVLLKETAFKGTSAELKRCVDYMAVIEGLEANWNGGLAVTGKVKGKPGRRPKDAGSNDVEDAAEGEQSAASEQPEGTIVEDGMTFVENPDDSRRRRA